MLFILRSIHVDARHGAPPPTTPTAAVRRSPGWKSLWWTKKNFEFALFFFSFLEMRRNFQKNEFFHLWTKAMVLLNPFRPGYFEKLVFKRARKATLNGYISKARASSESRLTFSESWLNFLRSKVVFCMLYPRGYTTEGCPTYKSWCHCHRLAGLKELMMSLHKFWVCSFLPLSLENEATL